MENVSYSSYPDSGDSSLRSCDIDESQSWDELPSNYRVKLMCSYGGKIQLRHHDNQLAYVGGDTKILAIDRNIKFSVIMNKLTYLCDDADICFKYQLPGEDLDALISVTNDEDLEHMMLEYDRLYHTSAKPARLRLFIFHSNPSSFRSDEVKSERMWFMDALNFVSGKNQVVSAPPAAAVAASSPDFLSGLDKGFSAVPVAKFTDAESPPPTVVSVVNDVAVGSECGPEDRYVIGHTMMNQHNPDLRRLRISAADEQARKFEEANSRGYAVEYYAQKVNEKTPPLPSQVAMPVLMPFPATYLPERHMNAGGYITVPGTEHTMYQIPMAAGIYQAPALRPVTGQVGQGYCGPQRVVQEVYTEQPPYNPVQPTTTAPSLPPQQQSSVVGAYTGGIGIEQAKVGVSEQGNVHVGYDSAGRQVYYTTAFQAVAADNSVMNQDGKVQVVGGNANGPQPSSM